MSSFVVTPTRSRAPGTLERESGAARRFGSAVRTRIYLPALAIPAAALVLIGIGWATGWGGADFAGSVTSLRVVVAGPVTVAIIAVFLVVERVRPAQQRSLFARGYRHDLLFAALSATLLVPLITALTLAFVGVVRAAAPWIVMPKVGSVPRWAIIAVIVVAMDGCNWLVHLANHRSRMLWRFHELHHSQEDMSVLTVFRTHPLIHVSYLVALLPATILLANGAMSTTVLVVYASVVAFAHSNTRLGFGPLERIFVSPNYHRIHHQVDGPQDVNLGFALTIWDQLSGRALFPTEDTIRADTGLSGRPLVVEQATARAHHLSVFAAQLIAPFRPMHEATDLPPIRAKSHADEQAVSECDRVA